ncbi:MAG: Na+/H+ antiporter subunit E [Verrucomicrobiaceae bacterium]|nr:Na+/H+ antiporter subunit E [Verrucomicrobiaceae bacterium]
MEKRRTKPSLHTALFFALLFLIWVVFSGYIDVFHLTLGLLCCALVTWMSSDLLFADRTAPLRSRLVQSSRLLGYVAWLLWQIVLANIMLLRLAFGPRGGWQPQIVRYECGLETDFEKYLLANSITLTPGTVTIKILGDTYYIHAINDEAAAGLDGEMERRIARIFATSDRKRKGVAAA